MALIDSRVVHGILWRIPTLVLLISFLIPSMGVMLNHHFPERDPYHSHLTNVAKHSHIGLVEHTHRDLDVPLSSTPVFLSKNLLVGSIVICSFLDCAKESAIKKKKERIRIILFIYTQS